MGSTRRSFTPEYKRDAVALIVDGGHTIVEVAKKLEISETGSSELAGLEGSGLRPA